MSLFVLMELYLELQLLCRMLNDLVEDIDDAVDAELESALVEFLGKISFKNLQESVSFEFE